jgi:membrane-anchored protein YejM (alkaline phosphatase superfamily)
MIASRKILLRWLSWYGFVNGLISAVIGIRYLFFYSFPTELSAISYVPLALITHFISLNYLSMVLLMMPMAILIPNKRFIFCLSIILMASINTLLIFDTNFFAENKYHLSLLTSVLFDQRTYMLLALQFLIVLIFEFVLAQQLFIRINNPDKSQLKGKPLVYVFLVSWIYVQGLHIWADATYKNAVTGFTRYLPLYRPVHAKRDLARLGLIDSERLRNERSIEKLGDFYSEQLNYPINPLSCQQRDREVKNIIVLLIDALRPEMVSNRITPAIDEWRTQALQFENHFSGGTSSRMGTFSLLYGIPTTYWRTYHDNQRASILIDQLTSYNYDVVAISSGGFGSPTLLDRTAFSQIKNLNVKKLSPSVKESNRMVTDKWMSWLSNYDRETPFFCLPSL